MKCIAKYKALDIARYVINYSWYIEKPVSNLKLQKLLYFIQACFLDASDGREKCFEEKIYAWDFGPVVPEVYREFKIFGSNTIPYIDEYIYLDDGLWSSEVRKFNDDFLNVNDKGLINGMVQHFKNFSASDLVTLTHKQSPWINSYKKFDSEITVESIYKFFKR